MTEHRKSAAKSRASYVPLTYHTLKTISTPEDAENGRKVYAGSILADRILDLPTDENVREYLVEAEGKKRRAKTQVHRVIERTLKDRPHDFAVLNSGIVLVARDAEVDDTKKTIQLLRPSIINGAQTQGVLREFYEQLKMNGITPDPIHIKFELIVTDDDALVGEISIARNFQNDVMTVSIVGRRGMLEELDKHFQAYAATPDGMRLRKKETDLAEDFVRTERMIQVLTALTPQSLWTRSFENGLPSKAYTYSASSKCLKDFQATYTLAKSDPKPDEPEHTSEQRKNAKALYQFYLDVAGQAWELYEKWKTHNGFKGTGLRKIDRDDDGNVTNVPDGIVFPILASLSVFAQKQPRKGWRIEVPPSADDLLIQAAKQVYMNAASSNPSTMGKSHACYALLNMIASSLTPRVWN
ncbi:MAG TPA: AIPR family protein [Pyrinomonadaceae bacterium]